jgi:hypothetical protein
MAEELVDKRTLQNDFFQIEYRTDALRISGITPTGKSNLLVDLRDMLPITTPYGDFRFLGGHRLWHAPEAMPRTYIPDGEVKVTDLMDGVRLELPTEPGTGIRKCMEVRLASASASLTLAHTLVNDGLWPVELAPWAITQFRLGGTVILPLPAADGDFVGLSPNRQFSLWPYARIDDPRLQLGDEFILFHAEALPPRFKIGYFNPHGWMAYWVDDVLFCKTFETPMGVAYADNNCNTEMYCSDQFVELESLGPLKKLDPGSSVIHLETWTVSTGWNSLPVDLQGLLTRSKPG